MTEPRKYATATAFRRALEEPIHTIHCTHAIVVNGKETFYPFDSIKVNSSPLDFL